MSWTPDLSGGQGTMGSQAAWKTQHKTRARAGSLGNAAAFRRKDAATRGHSRLLLSTPRDPTTSQTPTYRQGLGHLLCNKEVTDTTSKHLGVL
uniref:Uncharacterized protein n=1 Tax=Dromaius novaehollandiae TaxID=8790 RepID=A0A8C4JEK6_DRONO